MNEKTLKALEYFKIIHMVSEYASSSLGKKRILAIRPMTNIYSIQQGLQETSEVIKIIFEKGNIPLGGFSNIGPFLKKAKIGSLLSPGELLKIAQVLKTCEQVKDYMKEGRNQEAVYPIVSQIIHQIIELPGLTKSIFNAILSEEELSDTASPELYRIRRQIRQKNDAIREKLNQMIHSTHYQKYLQEPIVTLRQDRYVIPVKQEYRNNVPGLIHDQSSSGATLFIEPMSIVEMNNDLKTLKSNEKQEIESILIEFTKVIENNYEIINKDLELLTQLDVIFAKGYYSIRIEGREPRINQKGIIYFKQARHPLIPEGNVVASDIFLGKDFNTLVITGPNTGGKTVTLKTIGLLCLMVQSGFHIPVKEDSEVAIFQQIFADIGDEQSIEQSLSTFSSHMTNIVEILQNLGQNSLVLFDELGAGTDPIEGAALAMAILDDLYKRNIRTVATTHYSELKEYALTTSGIENASVEFDVETLKPTYILRIGIPGKSNAFEISKRLGLDEKIINAAKEYISQESIRFEDVLLDIENKRKQIQEEEWNAKKAREEIERIQKNVEEKEAKLESQKDKILSNAREEALRIVQDANKEVQKIIENLKRIEKEQFIINHNKQIEESRRKLKDFEDVLEKGLSNSNISNGSDIAPTDLKPGDEVLITTLNQKGYIITPPDDKDEVQVQAGILKVNVSIDNLKKIREKQAFKMTKRNFQSAKNKSIAISPQIDLRGKLSEEAMSLTDKYLDDAYLANLKVVTIIHGKGTGALRKSIHGLLKNHVHVKDYRLGMYNEGGEGVTIVTMK